MAVCHPFLRSVSLKAGAVVDVYYIKNLGWLWGQEWLKDWRPRAVVVCGDGVDWYPKMNRHASLLLYHMNTSLRPTPGPSTTLHTPCKWMFHIIILIHHPYRLHRPGRARLPSDTLTQLQEAHTPSFSLCHIDVMAMLQENSS